MIRPPFSQRQNPEQLEEYFAVQPGISEGLLPSLLHWTLEHYAPMSVFVDEQALGHLERVLGRQVVPIARRNDSYALSQSLESDSELLLDAADVALKSSGDYGAEVLEGYFVEARSAYCVGTDSDGYYAIQSRQPQEIRDFFESEARQPGRASEHLRNAWSKCFGLHPEWNEACSEAVKAIEVAGKPVIAPNDDLITLGKMCGLIRRDLGSWETDSEYEDSIETVLSMMEMVWKGHYRHGDESAPLEVSQEAAEMTVQTAVLLVSWFRAERIRMKAQHR